MCLRSSFLFRSTRSKRQGSTLHASLLALAPERWVGGEAGRETCVVLRDSMSAPPELSL